MGVLLVFFFFFLQLFISMEIGSTAYHDVIDQS